MSTKENPKFKAPEILLLSFCHFIHDVYSSFLAPPAAVID